MGCLLIIFALAYIPLAIIWHGYVASVVWRWFMVPIFHMQELSVAQCIAISIVVWMFIPHPKIETEDDGEKSGGKKLAISYSTGFFLPLLLLFEAWIVRHWL